MRTLGIPTVVDRLIQQALHQVLNRSSNRTSRTRATAFVRDGTRIRRCVKAREYVAKGKRWVVDIDLEKFFDRVNHDILMSQAGDEDRR